MNWFKSTHSSESANCVEVAWTPTGVAVRDSKDPDGPTLTFGRDTWDAFIKDLVSGGFTRS